MLAFMRANSELREELIADDLLCNLQWSGDSFLHSHSDARIDKNTVLADTSFADDLVIATLVKDNSQVVEIASAIFARTYRKFAVFCLPLNLKVGNKCDLCRCQRKRFTTAAL